MSARPVGGLRMVENGEADDKILAVLVGDPTYGEMASIGDVPRAVIDRLRHYFLTYKFIPGSEQSSITVDPIYDVADARAILQAASADYALEFGHG